MSDAVDVEPEDNPEVAEHLRSTRESLASPLVPEERRAELVVGACFLVLAPLLALLLPGDTPWDPLEVGLLVAAYAIASRVRIEYSAGYTDVSLLVLFPLLFAAPAGWVPLLILAGQLLSRAPEYLSREVHPMRALLALGNSFHALGPAVVLAAAGPGDPSFGDLPLFVLALLAQFLCDGVSGLARESLAARARPQLQVRVLAEIYTLDAVLAPVGLLIAIATVQEPFAVLLAAPLTFVLGAYAKERRTRLDHALELLESELEVERARSEVFAALSHGLQTPLASVTGLARTLHRHGEALGPERRGMVAANLHRESVLLRHVVRQALDFEALKGGEPLRARAIELDLAAAAREVAALFDGVEVFGEGHAQADAARLHQVLTALVSNAVAASPPGALVRLEVIDGEVTVADAGPGVPPAERARLFEGRVGPEHEAAGIGIGLVVARAAAEAMGGDLTAQFGDGSRFALTLPPVPAGVRADDAPPAAAQR